MERTIMTTTSDFNGYQITHPAYLSTLDLSDIVDDLGHANADNDHTYMFAPGRYRITWTGDYHFTIKEEQS
jgi:hypothetical protein